MLTDQWYAVIEAARVGAHPVALTRFGKPLVLWRTETGVHTAFDACPHRGASLSRGRLVDGCLECPYHGLRFASDGACAKVPAYPVLAERSRFDLHLLPTRVEWGLVWVWNGAAREDLPPLPWDAAIQAELDACGTGLIDVTDTFDVSYLRVMENLTDYHHVPFVHRWTVPSPAEVTAFSARRDGVHIWTEGTLGDRLHATTHLVGPCLGLLRFAGLGGFAVIATPIDAGNTWLFARYTQEWVRLAGVDRVLSWLMAQFDYRLLQRLQDAPVWRSQRLQDPADIGRYHLLEADAGVRLYFELHHELAG